MIATFPAFQAAFGTVFGILFGVFAYVVTLVVMLAVVLLVGAAICHVLDKIDDAKRARRERRRQ